MRLPRPSRITPALVVLAALALPTAAGAATGGSVAGNLSAKPPKGAEGAVIATSLADGALVSANPVTKQGAFKVSLPAGAYALSTTVVPKPGSGAVSTARFAVSLKPGQKRTKVKVSPKKLKLKKPGSAKASRAYVQERGQVTQGVTAVQVEPFTGGTGEWQYMGPGLAALLETDLVNDQQCKRAVVANSVDREKLKSELKLQQSKYVDPKTRVTRNWIIPDLRVGGTLSSSADGNSAAVTITITDARTGAVVDTIQTTLDGERVFAQEEQLAKALGERLCRRPAAYELHFTNTGTGTFGTHDTSGSLDTTLTALRTGGAAGEPPSAWSGVQNGNWTGVTASSKTDCSFAVGDTDFVWSAQLAVASDTQVKLDWTIAGRAMATLIITCPREKQPPFVQPGMPGPSLIGATPTSATLPLTGGVVPVTGGIASADGGWSNAGQIVVRPIWATPTP